MPIYEFKCGACGKVFEDIVSRDVEKVPCPECASQDTGKLMSRCRSKIGGNGGGDFASAPSMPSSGGGCAGCSGGSCSSCH